MQLATNYRRYLALLIGLITLLIGINRATGPGLYAQEALYQDTPPDAQSTSRSTPLPGANLAGLAPASPTAVVIANIPAYLWRHGCGPTAAGMVIGYWDGQGFDTLVAGDAYSQTTTVDEMIASEGPASHYTDYCEPVDSYPNLLDDKSEPPAGDEHADECVADYMKTSQSAEDNYYGWSWFSDFGPALKGYADTLGQDDYYVFTENLYMIWDNSLTWTTFTAEIDAGRPIVFLVDTDGYGGTDHFVTVIGYDTVANEQRYACLDTWDTDTHWYEFAPMADGQAWGIFGAITFKILNLEHDIFCPTVLRNS